MKILILTLLYTPDLGPSAALFSMLSKELTSRGNEVTVIAAVPHYPSGHVPEGFKNGFIQRCNEDGIKVIRIRVPSVERCSMLSRSLQFLSFQFGAAIACLDCDFDIVLASNPALEVWLPFMACTAVRKKPSIFNIHDVYPDVGVRLGIFKSKAVVSAVAAFEKSCLKRSDYVRISSESFRPGMCELGVPDDRMVLIYDWVDTGLIMPMSKDNSFAREYNLQDKFIVMYAGNIGLSQGLEYMLLSAEILSDRDDIHFVLVGEGAAKSALQKQAQEMNLGNVSFISFQPRERLTEVLAAASVSLVTLRCGVGVTALPSKTYSILASGRPILACVDDCCETADIITRSGAGICLEPENPEEMVESILYLKEQPCLCEQMGKNGRKWVEEKHFPSAAASQYEKLCHEIVS